MLGLGGLAGTAHADSTMPSAPAVTKASASATSAALDTHAVESQLYTMHRGKAGCFTWSYDDSGWASTTVYYHNTCQTKRTIAIDFAGEMTAKSASVKGGGSGHINGDGDVDAIVMLKN